MDKKAKQKWLRKVLAKLGEHVLLVEGKRDREALHEIGIATQIVLANGSTQKVVDTSLEAAAKNNKKIALLFDFDAEGERKTKFFAEAFYVEDENVDTRLRLEIGKLFKVRTIEELPTAYGRVLEEISEPEERNDWF